MPNISTRCQTFIYSVCYHNIIAGLEKKSSLPSWFKWTLLFSVCGFHSQPTSYHNLGTRNKSCLFKSVVFLLSYVLHPLSLEMGYCNIGNSKTIPICGMVYIGCHLKAGGLNPFLSWFNFFLYYFCYKLLHAIKSVHSWTFTSP